MKTFIISDIHSNLEALNAFVDYYKEFKKQKRVICLGDIVGYGPNPAECLDIVTSLTDKICMGNHDYTLIYRYEEEYMNEIAAEAIRYSRNQLNDKQKELIKGFPYSIVEGNVNYCHSSPVHPENWEYIVNRGTAEQYLTKMDCSLSFVGHSHIPGVYSVDKIKKVKGNHIIPRDSKTIVNVGSVGQPRNKDFRSSICVFDEEKWNVEYIKLEYDIEKTISKIKSAGLPDYLGERLSHGH